MSEGKTPRFSKKTRKMKKIQRSNKHIEEKGISRIEIRSGSDQLH